MMADQMAIIRALLDTEISSLQEVMATVHLADGEVLFHRGDAGDAFYIIESGQVRVFTLNEEGQSLTLATLGTGEAFGEIALLDDRPRSASIAADGPVTLRRLSRENFLARVQDSAALTQAIMHLLGERVRSLTDYIERMGHWARLVAAGEYDQAIENIQQIQGSTDRTLAAVADSVKDMVQAIKAREEKLRQELIQLRVQIDQSKREQQVKQITETDYFQRLTERSRNLRGQPKH